MKHVKLFEQFVNEDNSRKIEAEAKKWWKKTAGDSGTWDADDMDTFIDYLMDKGLVDPEDLDDVEAVRSNMEDYVENTLGYEFNY